MSASVANRPPSRRFPRGPNRWNHWVPYCQLTGDWLQNYSFEVMYHPLYSPDLTPKDFHLFGPLKKQLVGKRSATDADMKQAVTSQIQTHDTDLFYTTIQALVPWWYKYLNVSGENHLLHMCHVYIKDRIKFSASQCLQFVFRNFLILMCHDRKQ